LPHQLPHLVWSVAANAVRSKGSFAFIVVAHALMNITSDKGECSEMRIRED